MSTSKFETTTPEYECQNGWNPVPNALSIGDVNGDGVSELGFTRPDNMSNTASVYADQNCGRMTSYDADEMFGWDNSDPLPKDIALGDLNGDGKDEFVVALGTYASEMPRFQAFVYASDTPQFVYAGGHDMPAGYYARAVAFGDVDGDGQDEFIVGHARHYGYSAISGQARWALIKNMTCTPSNGGVEICDGVDNNCDGQTDEGFGISQRWYPDCDSDTYYDEDNATIMAASIIHCGASAPWDAHSACGSTGYAWAIQPGDCNDDPTSGGFINPGANEICDDLDNNCSGNNQPICSDNPGCDEGCDDDGDNFCDANMTTVGTPAVCPNGDGDCNDDPADSGQYVFPALPGEEPVPEGVIYVSGNYVDQCAIRWWNENKPGGANWDYDSNCNGIPNDGCCMDADGDGYPQEPAPYYGGEAIACEWTFINNDTILYPMDPEWVQECHATLEYLGYGHMLYDCDDSNYYNHPWIYNATDASTLGASPFCNGGSGSVERTCCLMTEGQIQADGYFTDVCAGSGYGVDNNCNTYNAYGSESMPPVDNSGFDDYCAAVECDSGYWQCWDGECIPDSWRCDGDNDCSDGEDEYGC